MTFCFTSFNACSVSLIFLISPTADTTHHRSLPLHLLRHCIRDTLLSKTSASFLIYSTKLVALHASQLTPWGIVLEKLLVAPQVKKFPAFHEILGFISVFTTTWHWTLLSQTDQFQILTPYLFKFHFNIILSLKPRSPKCSLPFRFSG
jgi:hypothetical protein